MAWARQFGDALSVITPPTKAPMLWNMLSPSIFNPKDFLVASAQSFVPIGRA